MTTFADIIRMTPDERAGLGTKVLTTRWWDPLEVRALSKQSWFAGLRRDLNQSGKITLDLGVFKYEQGGSAEEPTESEVAKIVAQLFVKTEPSTNAELRQLLTKLIQRAVFTPQFIMLEGELVLQLGERSYLDLTTTYVASILGIDTQKRTPSPPLGSEQMAKLVPKMKELFAIAGGTDETLRHWMKYPDNLRKHTVRGIEMALLALDTEGDRSKALQIVCPLDAVSALPDNTFGARVIGWLEHGPGRMIYIRAIAIADIFHFTGIDS